MGVKQQYLFLAAAIMVLVTLFSGTGLAAEFMFWPTEDAWVNQSSPDANYGNNTYLGVKDRSGNAEAYLKWSESDLDSLTGSDIASASLCLYQYQGTYSPGDTIDVHQVTSDWSEGSITWNSRPSFEIPAACFLNLDSGNNQWREWPGLENTIASWVGGSNYGLVLENNKDGVAGELFTRFYSSEYSSPELRPCLKITTTTATTTTPEPLSIVLFGLGGGMLCLARLRRKKEQGQL